MTVLIGEQLVLIWVCVYTGFVMAFAYDLIRVYRELKRHSHFHVYLQDIIFWILYSYIAYITFLKYNYGSIRYYALIGLALGMALYYFIISAIFVKYAVRILKFVSKPIRIVYRFVNSKLNRVIQWNRGIIKSTLAGLRRRRPESAEEAEQKEEIIEEMTTE